MTGPLDGVRVVELAPPPVETKLMRTEFDAELKGSKGMTVEALARKTDVKAQASARVEVANGFLQWLNSRVDLTSKLYKGAVELDRMINEEGLKVYVHCTAGMVCNLSSGNKLQSGSPFLKLRRKFRSVSVR